MPGCQTGNRRNPRKLTLFGAPSSEEFRQKWRKAIPRADREFESHCVVCEIHFNESYIERNFRHIINGEEVLLPKERPTLKPDAVPSIFQVIICKLV